MHELCITGTPINHLVKGSLELDFVIIEWWMENWKGGGGEDVSKHKKSQGDEMNLTLLGQLPELLS